MVGSWFCRGESTRRRVRLDRRRGVGCPVGVGDVDCTGDAGADVVAGGAGAAAKDACGVRLKSVSESVETVRGISGSLALA